MNLQFTLKQNERLALGQARSDCNTYNAVPSTAATQSGHTSGFGLLSSLPKTDSNAVDVAQMQNNFDERCQRTKQIVT